MPRTSRHQRELVATGALLAGVFLGLSLLSPQLTGPVGRHVGGFLWRYLGVGPAAPPPLGIAPRPPGFGAPGALPPWRLAPPFHGPPLLLPSPPGLPPGVRPGMLLLGGPSQQLLDSVRAIVGRDLDYSDRFEMISLPGTDSLTLGITALAAPRAPRTRTPSAGGAFVNYALYEALGADYTTARHHLRVLLKNGLVVAEGEGYGRMFFVSNVAESNWGLVMTVLEKTGRSQPGGADHAT